VWTDDGPLFCVDAVADPLTGLTAAGACVNAIRSGGRWLLDLSMAAVSADLTGPTLPTRARLAPLAVAAPQARPVISRAPELGADTAHVLAELGVDA
jgi:crotonobetainyl-CoA:carnitine CoA-transferase CaiB-like acyl-CoA transferase